MNKKILMILLIGLLVFSCLSLALAKVECPTCNGVGTIPCPGCNGTGLVTDSGSVPCDHCSGTGILTPTVAQRSMDVSLIDGATVATGTFRNKETVPVNATVTATLQGHSGVSNETTFPPGEDVTVIVQIDYASSLSGSQLLHDTTMTVTGIQNITCPYCDGTGLTTQTTTCSQCDGTGVIQCPTCSGTGYVEEGTLTTSGHNQNGSNITLIVAVAAIAVVGAGVAVFFVAKRRRVNERSLRRLSSRDFQEWVLKRVSGKPATSMDTSRGIDGFTSRGYPLCIKQADGIDMNAIDQFAAALAKSRARNGVMVAFSFGDDAIRGKIRARRNGLDIQTLTVDELIYNPNAAA
jgi:hypothetical protein